MWKEITEAQYHDALEVLPPALWLSKGFLLGEPETHRTCTVCNQVRPTYAAYVTWDARYFAGPSMTVLEFRALKVSEVLCGLSS